MDDSYALVSAFVGGGQGALPTIAASLTRISTVTNPGDSLTLKRAAPGLRFRLINADVNAANIFPLAGDAFAGSAVNAPFSLQPGRFIEFTCSLTGLWDAINIGANVLIFGASGAYTPTPGMISATAYVVPGAGGGEGGGRKASPNGAPATRPGLAGVLVSGSFSAAQIGASQPVVVGTGGARGAAATADNTLGSGGGNGGTSSFGPWLSSPGGGGGAAVAPTGNIMGAYTTFTEILVNMSGHSAGGAAPLIYSAASSVAGNPGCYAGGTFLAGGAAGAVGGPGGAGQSVSLGAGGAPFELFMGSGGGSGGVSPTVGGAGGAGGWPGGGGGAGGPTFNGGVAGAGGAGAAGCVIVVERF